MKGDAPTLERLPLIGRSSDLLELRGFLHRVAESGVGSTMIVSGAPGVGKSRLAHLVAEEAADDDWTTLTGRAYPAGTGAPYAMFAEAFMPAIRDLGAEGLSVLTRGLEPQLASLFPALRAVIPDIRRETGADRAELFWTFGEFVKRLAARQRVLLLLDDVHWADAASLELLYFLVRQAEHAPIALLLTVNDAEAESRPRIRRIVRALVAERRVHELALEPLSRSSTAELVRHAFDVDEAVTRDFVSLLFGWTRGNPFFIEETLKALVEQGQLRHEGGNWLGWELDRLELPRSIREAVLLRLEQLQPSARTVAETLAVFGSRTPYDTLAAVADLEPDEMVDALDQLISFDIIEEHGSARLPEYDFRHPMLRHALTDRIGLARERLLHGRVAETLAAAGDDVLNAGELAYHLIRAGRPADSPRIVSSLITAGEEALAGGAEREAADYLHAALERLDRSGDTEPERLLRVLRCLARARQRTGKFDEALRLRQRACEIARERDDHETLARTLRAIGVAQLWAGRTRDARDANDRALQAAITGGHDALAAAIRIARAACLQALGEVPDAREDLHAALELAQELGEPRLLAQAHRALLQLHTMAGPPDIALEHGRQALEFAEASGDDALLCTCHWAMALLAGLTGRGADCLNHRQQSTRLADELGSPQLRLMSDEIAIEYLYGVGDWDTGIALGERAIAVARSLNQAHLLPRLLVWTALIHLGRHDTERARAYVDEAWDISRAGQPGEVRDVHSATIAHIGRATLHRTLWEFEQAIEVGHAALAIVDRTGYTAWSVHRLLPTILEARLSLYDLDGARPEVQRLRRDAELLEHQLGLAWADAADAIVTWIDGDVEGSIRLLRAAAERLEAVPYVFDAARLRRQLAGRLAALDRRDEAISELRHVHEEFTRLGARFELDKTRTMFQELDARAPTPTAGLGAGALTARELDIVRLVADHRSNKAIGKELGISPRTVSTHLSNIYSKLEIGSRGELAEIAKVILTA